MVVAPYFRKKLKAMDFPLTSIDYLDFLSIPSDQLEDLFDGMNLDDWIDDVTDGKQDDAWHEGYQEAVESYQDKTDALKQEYEDRIEDLKDTTIKPVKIEDIPTMTHFKQFIKGNLALGNYVNIDLEKRWGAPNIIISIDATPDSVSKDAFATPNHQAYVIDRSWDKKVDKLVKVLKDLDGTDNKYKLGEIESSD